MSKSPDVSDPSTKSTPDASSAVVSDEEQAAFARLGGWDGLRPIIEDFIGRVYDDMIIGFFFLQVDRQRLIQRETAFAAAHLGGPRQYEGRPIPQAHKPHPINSGHFHRRLWLLEQTLHDHDVPTDIIDDWLAHNRQLEPAVTDGTDCVR